MAAASVGSFQVFNQGQLFVFRLLQGKHGGLLPAQCLENPADADQDCQRHDQA